MRVGVLIRMDDRLEEHFSELKQMGMECCQLVCWEEALFTDAMAVRVKKAAADYGVDITAFWCGWPGPKVWDFYEGQKTLGLVPEEYREMRLNTLLRGADFTEKIGVRDLVTHAGFMPENPYDPQYAPTVDALCRLAAYCRERGLRFLFETGQETPVTLLRVIEEIGTGNVGINLDPANLLLYGKGNPVDSLDVFGKYVWGIHGKDGEYPTDGKKLGQEKPLGQGRVNYPLFIRRLKEIGYPGDITIEREIEGEEQKKDIRMANDILQKLIQEIEG